MAAANQETIFAATVGDVLGDTVPSPRKAASDVGLLRQRVIMHLLERVPMVPAALQVTFSRLMQSGVLTDEAVSPELKCTAETGASGAIRLSETTPVSLPSRFEQDFERLELLGRGAFGEVWRCRHRLDGREYAVKAVQYRVGADAGQIEQHVLREASTWACLSHPNILRYHNSWAEVHRKHVVEEERTAEISPFPLADDWSFEESDGGVIFEASNLAAKPQSPAPAPTDSVDFTATTATHGQTPPILTHQGMPVVPGYCATLYLQAELCRKDTLMAWIAQRNAAMASGLTTLQDLRRWADQGLDIFRQIVVGLAHLHAHRCAHRDVKPSNILFGCDGKVRLGDFGLAKFLEDSGPLSLSDNNSSSSLQQGESTLGAVNQQHTRAVGTSSYASPEQLEGGPCGVETDVYALGMILAELLCPVSTHMERAVLLEGLRNGRKILGEAASALPIAARLAVAMTNPDPMQRPLVCEILEAYPEVEREVLLCFGNETALLSSPLAAASRTAATAAAEATKPDSTTAVVDSLHQPAHQAFAAQCHDSASSLYEKELALCSSSTVCHPVNEQIPLQEHQATQTKEHTNEVTESTKIEDTVKEFSFTSDSHTATTASSGCGQSPTFMLPTPMTAQGVRAGRTEPDKVAEGHHRRRAVAPQIVRTTSATWLPHTRGRRGRRRSCNGIVAPPIKHLRYLGPRHTVAALPSYSPVGKMR